MVLPFALLKFRSSSKKVGPLKESIYVRTRLLFSSL
jgi:hypothetical protein